MQDLIHTNKYSTPLKEKENLHKLVLKVKVCEQKVMKKGKQAQAQTALA